MPHNKFNGFLGKGSIGYNLPSGRLVPKATPSEDYLVSIGSLETTLCFGRFEEGLTQNRTTVCPAGSLVLGMVGRGGVVRSLDNTIAMIVTIVLFLCQAFVFQRFGLFRSVAEVRLLAGIKSGLIIVIGTTLYLMLPSSKACRTPLTHNSLLPKRVAKLRARCEHELFLPTIW